MKNYFMKFSIMFVMLLAVIGVGIISNETRAHAATVGQQLTSAESGWTRYDDTDENIKYVGTWLTHNNTNRYNHTGKGNSKLGDSLCFKFYGTKMRYICDSFTDYPSSVSVKIDNLPTEYFSEADSKTGMYQCLVYQKLNLPLELHTVEITMLNAGSYGFGLIDAIDTDGNLVPYNESIALDKSTMNLTEGDLGQLTAITTPSAVGVTWKSSDPSISTIEVDPVNGKIIKVNAIKEGTCTITATTADGSNLSASCTINVTKKTDPIPTPDPQPTDTEYITNIAHAKGTNTNNPGGEVTIIFHGTADTILSLVKTADVKDVWIGDNFAYTLVITNTGTKTAKAVVVSDPAPNHIDFNISGVTTTQGTVDSSSTTKNIIVNVGDMLPGGTVTIKIPSTVI
ncbi:Ig-like domain-containing protein [Clostridium saccharoperbutylacetonicum]